MPKQKVTEIPNRLQPDRPSIELGIFKTRKPITECMDEAPRTQRKNSQDKPSQNAAPSTQSKSLTKNDTKIPQITPKPTIVHPVPNGVKKEKEKEKEQKEEKTRSVSPKKSANPIKQEIPKNRSLSPKKEAPSRSAPSTKICAKRTSRSPEKRPPSTQTIVVRKKQTECAAESVVLSKQVSRETAKKTIACPPLRQKVTATVVVPVKTKPLCKAKEELKKGKEVIIPIQQVGPVKKEQEKTLAPKKEQKEKEKEKPVLRKEQKENKKEETPSPETSRLDSLSRSQSVSEYSEATKAEVEKQLTHIAQQAEQLAKTVQQVADSLEEEERQCEEKEKEEKEKEQEDIARKSIKEIEKLFSPELSARHTTFPSEQRKKEKEKEKEEKEMHRSAISSSASCQEFGTGKGSASAGMSTSTIEYKKRSGRASNKDSLTERLSKGISDLTSSDRLQKWKSKLQQGRRSHDTSEPPPTNRRAVSPTRISHLDWAGSTMAARRDEPMTASFSGSSLRPLHPSKSATNALVSSLMDNGAPVRDMEHRTLKNRETSRSHRDIHVMENGFKPLELPPTRFAALKAKEQEIIRPIAFRPIGNSTDDFSSKRQSTNTFEQRRDRIVTSASAHNIHQLSQPPMVRPRPMYPPSTSFFNQPLPSPPKPLRDENEYDTVCEYMDRKSDAGSNGSDYSGGFLAGKLTSSGLSGLSGMSSTGTCSSGVGSPPAVPKKPSMTVSRQSSGVHVTPSPSDSGIVDYETIIRDKENELRDVRLTMEQNEEIIIKVYQEKEKTWKAEKEQLKARLAAAERGESALRQQLTGCQRQTESMSRTIDGLRSERGELQSKYSQLERDLSDLRRRVDEPRPCNECSRANAPSFTPSYPTSSVLRRAVAPVPAPRTIKADQPSDGLRDEVADLRKEVQTLKDALNNQLSQQSPRDRLI